MGERDSAVLRFGVFEADTRSGELRRRGLRVRLQEQPFQVLAMLAQRAGDVVTRDELRQALWPSDTFVDFDHGLNTAINKLRDALGDSASSPRFIETLPRRGYRFVAPVERVQDESIPPSPAGKGGAPSKAVRSFEKSVPSSEFLVPVAGNPTPPETSEPVPPFPTAGNSGAPSKAVPSSEFQVPTRSSEDDVPHASRALVRTLFALAQIMYLVFYTVALFRLEHLHEVLPATWVVPVMIAIVITAPVGIALRLYLLTAVGFDYVRLGANFTKLFRAIFVLDLIWALAPFLITPYIGVGGAIAACVALLYLPFSQRTLVRMGYRSSSQ